MPMREDRVVIILGAGATLADGLRKPAKRQPPLDRGFFSNTISVPAYSAQLRPVVKYMSEHYGANLRAPEADSLERVMAVLYTDVFGGVLRQEAFVALRTLIRTFLLRLASTTNDIAMTSRCLLYRLIVGFLNQRIAADNITVITFNQDIQAEKALDEIRRKKTRTDQSIFAFPGCYNLPRRVNLTFPSDPRAARFEPREDGATGIALLKLHGSLNWYSLRNTKNPSRKSLFDPSRSIGITTRKSIETSMMVRVQPGVKKRFTFPIVVPPVVHKSGILPEDLRPVWALAEERLRSADRVVIFGYSCPANDWESANLVSRSLTKNHPLTEMAVIDPDPGVVLRYVRLANLSRVSYYSSAEAYLTAE